MIISLLLMIYRAQPKGRLHDFSVNVTLIRI